MDFAKAFTYVTEDENWIAKIGIGTLMQIVAFIILPIPILVGYQIAISRNVMNGEKRPLPEWNDLGKFFMDGLYLIIVYIVYTLPITLLLCLGMGVSVLPALAGENEDMMAALGGVAAVVWIVLGCLAMLFGLAMAFIAPAVTIQYIRTNDFRACFRFGEVIEIARQNVADIILMIVALFGAALVLSVVVGVLYATFCGIILAIPLTWVGQMYFTAISGHLIGQMGAKTPDKASGYLDMV